MRWRKLAEVEEFLTVQKQTFEMKIREIVGILDRQYTLSENCKVKLYYEQEKMRLQHRIARIRNTSLPAYEGVQTARHTSGAVIDRSIQGGLTI